MRARGILPILLLNIIVSVVVAFGIIAVFGENEDGDGTTEATFEPIVITTTPDPNITPQVIVVTATPAPGTPQVVAIPEEALQGAGVTPGAATSAPLTTPDPNVTAVAQADGESVTAAGEQLPPGCIIHSLESGENPSVVAVEYGANFFDLMAVNNLTEEDAIALDVGDELIVPLEGCPIEQFIEETPDDPADDAEDAEADADDTTDDSDDAGTEDTGDDETDDETGTDDEESDVTPTPTIIPTVTLAPTAENSEIVIVEIIGAGDITREALVIRNDGLAQEIGGWTLSDLDENVFTFPADFRLFGGAGITINTRDMNDESEQSAIRFFWGLDQAVYESGDVLTLADEDGVVQATYRVP